MRADPGAGTLATSSELGIPIARPHLHRARATPRVLRLAVVLAAVTPLVLTVVVTTAPARAAEPYHYRFSPRRRPPVASSPRTTSPHRRTKR